MYNKNSNLQNPHDKKQKKRSLVYGDLLKYGLCEGYFTINFFPFTITTPL